MKSDKDILAQLSTKEIVQAVQAKYGQRKEIRNIAENVTITAQWPICIKCGSKTHQTKPVERFPHYTENGIFCYSCYKAIQ